MRIDVADPGSERLAIVAALVSAGFEVRAIEVREVPSTRADLVVLAGDARDALEALRTLRDDGSRPDVPVILVGTPEGTDPIASGPGFGAERVLGRPVDEEQLVEAARLLIRPRSDDVALAERVPELTLELAQRDRTSAWRTHAGEEADAERDDPSGVSAIHPMVDHEDPESAAGERSAPVRSSSPPSPIPSLRKSSDRPSSPARRPSVPPPPTGVSVVERQGRASEMPPPPSMPGFSLASFSGVPGTGPGTGSDIVPLAAISEQLRSLLAQADRRVFPSLAAIDVSIPAGEASARELIPDEFLDDGPGIDAEPEEEVLFLPVAPPSGWLSGAGVPSAVTPRPYPGHAEEDARDIEPAKKTTPGTPGTMSQRPARPASTLLTGGNVTEGRAVSRRGEVSATLPDDPSLGSLAPDGTRRLRIVPGGMLRALVSLVLHRSTTRVELRTSSAASPDVVLGFSQGELISVEGPIHQEALSLTHAGAGVPAVTIGHGPRDEDDARARLVSLVERREISLPMSAFLLAAAERALVLRMLSLGEGEARFCPAAERDAAPRLGRTGPLLLVLAGALEQSALTRVAGEGAQLAPSRTFAALCEALEPPREVISLFERATDGATLTDLARASLVVPGLSGMVLALLAGGGLTVLAHEDDGGMDARAAEALVREHARRAEDADYFAMLGVPRDATDAAIRAARDGRVSMLAALPLDALGLGALGASRRSAIDAVEEAALALASPRLRAAYARALAPSAPLAPSPPGRPG